MSGEVNATPEKPPKPLRSDEPRCKQSDEKACRQGTGHVRGGPIDS